MITRKTLTWIYDRARVVAMTCAGFNALSRLVAALAIALALATLWLNLIGIAGSGISDRSKMAPDSGQAFRVEPPQPFKLFASPGDSTNAPSRSNFELFENDVPLTVHTPHATIREGGHGAFSHWGNVLWFSSTDGTDPRSNGHVYRFERRLFLLDSVAMLLVLFAASVTWYLFRTTVGRFRSITTGSVGRHRNLALDRARLCC